MFSITHPLGLTFVFLISASFVFLCTSLWQVISRIVLSSEASFFKKDEDLLKTSRPMKRHTSRTVSDNEVRDVNGNINLT